MTRLIFVIMGAMFFVAMPAARAADWSGYYIGVHAGMVRITERETQPHFNNDVFNPITGAWVLDRQGPMFGVHAGHRWKLNTLVFGFEADLSWSNIEVATMQHGAPSRSYNVTTYVTNNWLASVVAATGVEIGSLLVYGKAGLAWMDMRFSSLTGISSASIFAGEYPSNRIKDVRHGFVYGAGAETRLLKKWIARIEYSYWDMKGGDDYLLTNGQGFHQQFGTASNNFKTHAHIVRIGLSYPFGM